MSLSPMGIQSFLKTLTRWGMLLVIGWAIIGDPPVWLILILMPALLVATTVYQSSIAEWLERVLRDQDQ